MDIATVVGFIAIVTTLMVGIGSNLSTMLDPPSAIIVVLGTYAALLVSFPLPDMINVPTSCLGYAIIPPTARNVTVDRNLSVGIEIYRRAGTYAFALGWVGVLIGIAIMGQSGADMSLDTLGRGLSICVLTALYGTVISYLFCLPIRTKLTRIQAELAIDEGNDDSVPESS